MVQIDVRQLSLTDMSTHNAVSSAVESLGGAWLRQGDGLIYPNGKVIPTKPTLVGLEIESLCPIGRCHTCVTSEAGKC